ncbi:MAG: hypothetical protein M3Q99_20610 [Acidobacteriota bacterium]|nr:hypothetical protein [Acidobacteriota bacterium]
MCANVCAQSSDEFFGIKISPGVRSVINEIEYKTGEEIYIEFVRQEDYMLGSSFISEDGVAVVLIDYSLEDDAKKLEAVVVHELLHLRLRVNNFPTFVFSPTVNTAKGRARDTEQGNINDLKNMIEHQVFKPEMEKFGLNKIIDLAGDIAKGARANKNQADGQDDAINYARAILEYSNAKDIIEVQKIYEENGWKVSLRAGREIAAIISQTNLQTPKDVEAVFLKCLLKLYPPPRPEYVFKLTLDAKNKLFRRMIINTATQTVRRKRK